LAGAAAIATGATAGAITPRPATSAPMSTDEILRKERLREERTGPDGEVRPGDECSCKSPGAHV